MKEVKCRAMTNTTSQMAGFREDGGFGEGGPHMVRSPFKMLFGPVPPVSLAKGNAALVLVDVQRLATSLEHGLSLAARERGLEREFDSYFAQVEVAIQKTARLLDACRKHGLRVIYSLISSKHAVGSETGLQMRVANLPIPSGPLRAEVCSEVRARPSDMVFSRTAFGLFSTTDLESYLVDAEINTVILAGMLANVTVAAGAREAADRNFKVVVVSDACASETLDWHILTMSTLVGGLIRVLPTQHVIEMLEGVRT